MPDFRLICELAARIGGNVLQELVGQVGFLEKATNDLVTEADVRSQRAISEYLHRAVSGDMVFIGEEDATAAALPVNDDVLIWLVDPLDGTTNYLHGFPHYCVSVAAVRQQQILAAAVFNPLTDECFSAGQGEGASLNGNDIQTSHATQLASALLAASLPASMTRGCPELERFLRACESTRSVRRTGSAALNLCYVACGRLDAYWATTLKPWDAAAGVLLVKEAGGYVSNLSGDPFEIFNPLVLSAATPELAQELQQLLRV